MKYKLLLTLSCFFIIAELASQAPPEGINYQAIARDAGGNELINKNISIRLSIRTLTPNGNIVYRELHHPLTNNFGLFTIIIGKGNAQAGNFAGINWGVGDHFLETEMDPAGGTAFISLGTTQFMAVPYALYAKNAPAGLNCWDLNGNGIKEPAEDINSDGKWDVLDCRGLKGDSGSIGPAGLTGPPGDPGAAGLNCWDLNGNGIKDASEDLNGDGKWDALDCKGSSVVPLPVGAYGQTLHHNGTAWVPNSLLYNTGGTVAIGTTFPDSNMKLDINGKVKIKDGSEGAGKVFTSDINGVGTWQNASSSAGIAFRAVSSATSGSFSGNTVTINYINEVLDIGAGYDPSTSAYTIPADGVYYIDASIGVVNSQPDNQIRLSIEINGTVVSTSAIINESQNTSSRQESCRVSGLFQLTAGTKINIVAGTGSTATRTGTVEYNWFMGYKVF